MDSSYEEPEVDVESLKKDLVNEMNHLSIDGGADTWTICETIRSNPSYLF